MLAGAAGNVCADEVGGGKGDAVEGAGLAPLRFRAFDFWASEAGGGVCGVDGGDEARFAEVVFCFEILDFGAVGAVDDPYGNREYGVALDWGLEFGRLLRGGKGWEDYFCIFSDGFVYDIVIRGYLLLCCVN